MMPSKNNNNSTTLTFQHCREIHSPESDKCSKIRLSPRKMTNNFFMRFSPSSRNKRKLTKKLGCNTICQQDRTTSQCSVSSRKSEAVIVSNVDVEYGSQEDPIIREITEQPILTVLNSPSIKGSIKIIDVDCNPKYPGRKNSIDSSPGSIMKSPEETPRVREQRTYSNAMTQMSVQQGTQGSTSNTPYEAAPVVPFTDTTQGQTSSPDKRPRFPWRRSTMSLVRRGYATKSSRDTLVICVDNNNNEVGATPDRKPKIPWRRSTLSHLTTCDSSSPDRKPKALPWRRATMTLGDNHQNSGTMTVVVGSPQSVPKSPPPSNNSWNKLNNDKLPRFPWRRGTITFSSSGSVQKLVDNNNYNTTTIFNGESNNKSLVRNHSNSNSCSYYCVYNNDSPDKKPRIPWRRGTMTSRRNSVGSSIIENVVMDNNDTHNCLYETTHPQFYGTGNESLDKRPNAPARRWTMTSGSYTMGSKGSITNYSNSNLTNSFIMNNYETPNTNRRHSWIPKMILVTNRQGSNGNATTMADGSTIVNIHPNTSGRRATMSLVGSNMGSRENINISSSSFVDNINSRCHTTETPKRRRSWIPKMIFVNHSGETRRNSLTSNRSFNNNNNSESNNNNDSKPRMPWRRGTMTLVGYFIGTSESAVGVNESTISQNQCTLVADNNNEPSFVEDRKPSVPFRRTTMSLVGSSNHSTFSKVSLDDFPRGTIVCNRSPTAENNRPIVPGKQTIANRSSDTLPCCPYSIDDESFCCDGNLSETLTLESHDVDSKGSIVVQSTANTLPFCPYSFTDDDSLFCDGKMRLESFKEERKGYNVVQSDQKLPCYPYSTDDDTSLCDGKPSVPCRRGTMTLASHSMDSKGNVVDQPRHRLPCCPYASNDEMVDKGTISTNALAATEELRDSKPRIPGRRGTIPLIGVQKSPARCTSSNSPSSAGGGNSPGSKLWHSLRVIHGLGVNRIRRNAHNESPAATSHTIAGSGSALVSKVPRVAGDGPHHDRKPKNPLRRRGTMTTGGRNLGSVSRVYSCTRIPSDFVGESAASRSVSVPSRSETMMEHQGCNVATQGSVANHSSEQNESSPCGTCIESTQGGKPSVTCWRESMAQEGDYSAEVDQSFVNQSISNFEHSQHISESLRLEDGMPSVPLRRRTASIESISEGTEGSESSTASVVSDDNCDGVDKLRSPSHGSCQGLPRIPRRRVTMAMRQNSFGSNRSYRSE